jgi:phosphatidate cytidylyltransferase
VLRSRLLTAAVALPILIVLVCCAPSWLFAAILFSLTTVGLHEYFTITQSASVLPPAIGTLWGGAVSGAMMIAAPETAVAVLLAGFFLTFTLSLRDPHPQQSFAGLSIMLLGVIYIGFLLPHLVWMRAQPDGAAWVFFILLVVMIGDSAAYGAGRMWGKRKLIPHISPGKTIEGSIGAVGGQVLTAVGSWLWLLPNRSLLEILCLALGIGTLAQIGDLCESALKRAFDVKDSGWIFPGHGGVLDRVDSVLFPSAFLYYYVTLWR